MSELTGDEREAVYEAALVAVQRPENGDVLCETVERIIAARISAVEQERPFWRDKATGEPCPRRGELMCTATDPAHRHIAVHMWERHLLERAEKAEADAANWKRTFEANIEVAGGRKQRVAELEAAMLALADEWEQPFPSPEYPDAAYRQAATELRALVPDTTALDRIRQEAVEAALAPIEALHFRRPWATALDSVTFGQTEFPDQCNCCRVPWPCLTGTFLAAARDAAGRSELKC